MEIMSHSFHLAVKVAKNTPFVKIILWITLRFRQASRFPRYDTKPPPYFGCLQTGKNSIHCFYVLQEEITKQLT